MDLIKHGNFLRDLRKRKGMTQKQVAEALGVLPKTVSKWETGHGFPDVSTLSALADALGVSERSLLVGDLKPNKEESGNMKRTKFYVCPHCGSFMQGVGECQPICCGKPLEALIAQPAVGEHAFQISEIEDDFYIEFSHEMTKSHYIAFVAYIGYDRVLTLRLYPEQEAAARMPKAYNGKIVYYCNQHGLFEYPLTRKRK